MFNFKEFNWREAVNNIHGKSSAGLFIAFFYGIALLPCTVYTIFVHYNDGLLFIGTQYPIIFTYLFGR